VRAIPGINAVAIPGTHYGLVVACGAVDDDAPAKIAAGAGPDPAAPSQLHAFGYDGTDLVPIGALDVDPFSLSYGLRVAIGVHGT